MIPATEYTLYQQGERTRPAGAPLPHDDDSDYLIRCPVCNWSWMDEYPNGELWCPTCEACLKEKRTIKNWIRRMVNAYHRLRQP